MAMREAVVVGINTYEQQPLSFCVPDARDMAALLQMPEYGFSVATLADEYATKRGILTSLEAMFARNPEVCLFYFSGHGCVTDVGTYLVTVEGQPFDEGVDLEAFRRFIDARCPANSSMVVVLDCCHAGAASLWPGTSAKSISASAIQRALPTLGKGKSLLAACEAGSLAFEQPEIEHGVFTYHLLQGLLGDAADADGRITPNSVFDWICTPFEGISGQVPVFKGDMAGRIVLGEGFPAQRKTVLGEARAVQLEEEALRLLDDYEARRSLSISEWKEQGYRSATQSLEPIVRWFQRTMHGHPELEKRSRFRQAWSAANARLAQLGTLEEGVQLKEGTLDKRLGEGAFGSVWRVTPATGSEPLAYKVYHPNELTQHDKVGRFARGYRAMSQLEHPNIVHVMGYTEVPVGFFMQFVDGPNLRQLGDALSEPQEIISVLITVAETLLHAHGRAVVHRDVKPENIVMRYDPATSSWLPYLTDFDLAWFTAATFLTRDALGTVFYAAPEQFSAPQSAGAKAKTVDVYAFGQLMFYTVTKTDPSALRPDANAKLLQDRLGKWPGEQVSRSILNLYSDCTFIAPDKRLQDFRLVADRLNTIMRELRARTVERDLTSEDFLTEVAYSLIGLGAGRATSENLGFVSRSGRTRIELTARIVRTLGAISELEIEVQLRPHSRMTLQGVSNERARAILNNRISDAIASYAGVRRRSGKAGAFEAFLDLSRVPLRQSGVVKSAEVVARVLDAIERD